MWFVRRLPASSPRKRGKRERRSAFSFHCQVSVVRFQEVSVRGVWGAEPAAQVLAVGSEPEAASVVEERPGEVSGPGEPFVQAWVVEVPQEQSEGQPQPQQGDAQRPAVSPEGPPQGKVELAVEPGLVPPAPDSWQ